MKKWLAVASTASLIWLAACSGNGSNSSSADGSHPAGGVPSLSASVGAGGTKADPEGRYDKTVTFTTILATNPDANFPEGESYENNQFNQWIDNKLNIKENFLWTAQDGDPFYQKLNLAIASDDIPDIFTVGGPDAHVILKRLVDNDMIADLTQVYQDYAGDYYKKVVDANQDAALKAATFNGKLMAIPNQMNNDGAELVWARQDWLDRLNLPAPNTIDNLITVAQAFKDQDPDGDHKADTKGLGVQKDFIGVGGGIQTVSPIFSAMGAFPLYWLPDDNGDLQYGGVQPEVKPALAKLADMYKMGLIPKDFALLDFGQATEDVGNGTTGLLFQPWWAPTFALMNSLQNNANADWKAYPLLNGNGEFVNAVNTNTTSYVVVRKGYEHPELVMKYTNVLEDVSQGLVPEITDLQNGLYKDATDKTPFATGTTAVYTDTTERSWLKFKDIMAGKADESILNPGEIPVMEQIKAEQENPKKDVSNWAAYTSWTSGIDVLTNSDVKFVTQQFNGTTETMKSKWQHLVDLQKEAYINIMMGDKPVDSFDTFVQQWKSQGGDRITKEVQESAEP